MTSFPPMTILVMTSFPQMNHIIGNFFLTDDYLWLFQLWEFFPTYNHFNGNLCHLWLSQAQLFVPDVVVRLIFKFKYSGFLIKLVWSFKHVFLKKSSFVYLDCFPINFSQMMFTPPVWLSYHSCIFFGLSKINPLAASPTVIQHPLILYLFL